MRRLEDRKVQYGCHEYRQHLADVGSEEELYRLADVGVNPAAFLNSRNDCSEVVVREYHVGDVLRYVSTGYAHAYSDVSGLDGRSVVYSVACHGCDHLLRAPRLYYPYLMLRLYPCIYRVGSYLIKKLLIAHIVESRSENGVVCTLYDSEFLTDSDSCIDLVACYHDRPDTRLAALSHGGLYLRSDRIDHSQQSNKDEVVLKSLIRIVIWSFVINACCKREDSQSLACHSGVVSLYVCGELVCQRLNSVISKDMSAVSEHYIRSSLSELHVLGLSDQPVELGIESGRRIHVVVLVHCRHHLAARIERSLADAREHIYNLCLRQILN